MIRRRSNRTRSFKVQLADWVAPPSIWWRTPSGLTTRPTSTAKTLVGGHLGRLGVRADGDVQKQYIADLTASTKAAMSLDPTPYFQKYGPAGNSWAIFKTYLDAVARQAADPVIAKYTGVLAAADVFTTDNCATMLESLRIDAGSLGPFSIRP